MDREDELMEILSTYFANCYFNSLYANARNDFNDEKFQKIEDAYKSSVTSFYYAFSSIDKQVSTPSCFIKVLDNIKNEFNTNTHKDLNYMQFIEYCASFLIPHDDYLKSSYDIKADAVRKYLTHIVAILTAYTTNDKIKDAVSLEIRKDNKKMFECILGWKNYLKQIFVREKNSINSLILLHKSGVDTQNNLTSIRGIETRLEKIVKDLIKEKACLVKERNQFAKLIQIYRSTIRSQMNEILILRTKNLSHFSKAEKPKKKKHHNKTKFEDAVPVETKVPEDETPQKEDEKEDESNTKEDESNTKEDGSNTKEDEVDEVDKDVEADKVDEVDKVDKTDEVDKDDITSDGELETDD